MKTDAPNLNALWCSLLMEELVRQQVKYVAVAPGSRSTPLALAAAAHPALSVVVHLDERALAFHALGWGKATGRPAVVITTSGTAVANLAPAVAEAALAGVPLLVLTADRPPELRDTAANQTMDQVKYFGTYVRWHFDLPCPSPDLPLRSLLSTVDQAVARSRWGQPGPVHLNCMFREPLALTVEAYPRARLLSPLKDWLNHGRPFTNYMPASAQEPEDPVAIPEVLREARRGVILAGALTPDEAEAALKLAAHLHWPVLPDVQSGLRLGAQPDEVIAYADLVLGHADWLARHRPDAVVRVGGRFVSKRMAALGLEDHGVPVVLVTDSLDRQDAGGRVDTHWFGEVSHLLDLLRKALPADGASSGWLAAWRQANEQAGQAVGAGMSRRQGLHEPAVAWALTRRLPPDHALFVGNSLPIRLIDSFAAAGFAWSPVGTNRGVSGIDGLLATATGYAAGRGKPVTLLIGDLSLLHDLGALALLKQSAVPVVTVVINNDGGGIFSFLPVAGTTPDFESLFGLPHGRTFAGAAAMFAIPYYRVRQVAAFVRAYREACLSQRSALIEVSTDRKTTLAAWRSLQKAVAARLE